MLLVLRSGGIAMASNLAINKISLSRRRRSLPTPLDGHRDIWFDVIVDVENRGDKPLSVVNEMRKMDYEPQKRILTLELTEHVAAELGEGAPTFHLPGPRWIDVKAHGTMKLTVAIPAILNETKFGPDSILKSTQTDIRKMKTIKCNISVSAYHPENLKDRKPNERRQSGMNWQTVVSAETEVEPDMRD
jgi:hypothetical protein